MPDPSAQGCGQGQAGAEREGPPQGLVELTEGSPRAADDGPQSPPHWGRLSEGEQLYVLFLSDSTDCKPVRTPGLALSP